MLALGKIFWPVGAAAALIAGAPLAAEECRLCQAETGVADKPMAAGKSPQIEIVSGLMFNRAAHTGQGKGRIIVNANGESNINGGLINLGGYSVAGTAIIRGEAGRHVRIELPAKVEMTSATGGKIEIANLRTNLVISPQLDASGQLTFSFGGDLSVDSDISGKFRGRIPITAQYE
jgi:hypothetical protein